MRMIERPIPKHVRVLRTFLPRKKTGVLLFAYLEIDTMCGPIEIRNWRLFRTQDRYEVGYPNAPITAKDGKQYRQVVPRADTLREEIKRAMVASYEAISKAKEALAKDKSNGEERFT